MRKEVKREGCYFSASMVIMQVDVQGRSGKYAFG